MVFPPFKPLPGTAADDDVAELNEQVDLRDLHRSLGRAEHPAADSGNPGDPAADADIPVLTEVVQLRRPDVSSFAELPTPHEADTVDERARQDVLERLLHRCDALLDAQLQAALTPVVTRASELVARELHDALERVIRDVVAQAVSEELGGVRATIAERTRSSDPT